MSDPDRAPSPLGDAPPASPLAGGEPPTTPAAEPSILDVALRGLCPRCGAPTLFRGILAFAGRCTRCDLDFDAFNVGDGPAAFLTMILGAVVLGLAFWLEVAVSPPWWVHALLWPPVTLALVVGSLRIAKAALIAAEYRNKASEGRFR